MRLARAFVTAIAAGAMAASCQLVSGVSSLEIAPGAGGAITTTTSAGGHGGATAHGGGGGGGNGGGGTTTMACPDDASTDACAEGRVERPGAGGVDLARLARRRREATAPPRAPPAGSSG